MLPDDLRCFSMKSTFCPTPLRADVVMEPALVECKSVAYVAYAAIHHPDPPPGMKNVLPTAAGRLPENSSTASLLWGIALAEDNCLAQGHVAFQSSLPPLTDQCSYKGLTPLPQFVTIYRAIPDPGFPMGSAEAGVGTASLKIASFFSPLWC